MRGFRIAVSFGIVVATLALAATSGRGASLCTVSNTSLIAFDTLEASGGPHDARASFVVTCARTESAVISLFYSHHMKGDHNEDLAYDLYSSANHAAIWGSGADGAPVAQMFAAGRPSTMYIYARIQANQQLPAGHFTDDLEIRAQPL